MNHTITECAYCSRPAWYQDRGTDEMLCPRHARLEVRGPRPRTSDALPTVRQSTPADDETVLALWRHFWDEDQMDCFGRSYRAAELPSFLVEENGQVVGALSYAIEREWDAINIVALQVLPGYQGRGAARALLSALEEVARGEGIGRLLVATSNDNTLSLSFYQRLGFQIKHIEVGAIEPDHPDDELVGIGGVSVRDEIQMVKPLPV